jgi:hypothetical protein
VQPPRGWGFGLRFVSHAEKRQTPAGWAARKILPPRDSLSVWEPCAEGRGPRPARVSAPALFLRL